MQYPPSKQSDQLPTIEIIDPLAEDTLLVKPRNSTLAENELSPTPNTSYTEKYAYWCVQGSSTTP